MYKVVRSMKWPSVSLTSGPFERKTFLERDLERWFISGFTCMHVHTLIKLLNLILIQILPGALVLPAKCVWSKAAKILILCPGSGDFSRPKTLKIKLLIWHIDDYRRPDLRYSSTAHVNSRVIPHILITYWPQLFNSWIAPFNIYIIYIYISLSSG